jgi:anti-sigma factor ChrR (cupin superfamily)
VAEIALPGLLVGSWRDMTFEPFAGGVEICRLIVGEPAVALLRYAPAATVQRHRHEGLETIMVLDGAQSDEHGDYEAGSVVFNPLGSEHSIWSESGCVILIHWERPVRFLEASDE